MPSATQFGACPRCAPVHGNIFPSPVREAGAKAAINRNPSSSIIWPRTLGKPTTSPPTCRRKFRKCATCSNDSSGRAGVTRDRRRKTTSRSCGFEGALNNTTEDAWTLRPLPTKVLFLGDFDVDEQFFDRSSLDRSGHGDEPIDSSSLDESDGGSGGVGVSVGVERVQIFGPDVGGGEVRAGGSLIGWEKVTARMMRWLNSVARNKEGSSAGETRCRNTWKGRPSGR
jgi:hypothetical protein